MTRRLVNLVTVASLLLCLTAALFWQRSGRTKDQLRVGAARGRYWQINTYPGGVAVTVATGWYENQPWEWTDVTASPAYPRAMRGRPYVQRSSNGEPAIDWMPASRAATGPVSVERGTWAPAGVVPTMPYVTYDVRYWLPVAVTTLPVLVRLLLAGQALQRRRRWARAGLCQGCGYDLTGNQTGVCPECGGPAAAAKPTVGAPAFDSTSRTAPRPSGHLQAPRH